jgi:putative colanic acid biosynthesis UDP-glucose lipid carrier transferase
MHGQTSHMGEVKTISVYDNPMQGGFGGLKRLEDIFLVIGILTVIALPMLIIALTIKFTSKGLVIFKQVLYGLNSRKIRMWKYRSMTVTENDNVIIKATKGD